MAKLSSKEIEFCGKKRRFKRCPNKELRDAHKGVEAIQKEAVDKREDLLKKITEANKKRQEAAQLTIDSAKDSDNVDENKKKADRLIKRAEKIEKEVEEMTEKMEEELKDFDIRLAEAYDKVCVVLLEPMEPGEFTENHDSTDFVIAKNLGLFYDMYMTNFPEAKIESRLRQIIDAEHENQMNRFRQEEE